MLLKSVRRKYGYTQQQVSDALSIPLGTLRRWEQGVNEPDTASLVLLADFYGCSTDELLGSRFVSIEYDSAQLTGDERRLLNLFRSCDQKGREYLLQVAEVTAGLFGGR